LERRLQFFTVAVTEKDAEFWKALHAVARQALDALPYAAKPDVIAFPYEGEEWKEQAQIDEKEDACYPATDEFIREFCRTHQWPQKSTEHVRYFVEQRLRWAVSFLRILTIRWEKTGLTFLPRPEESGHELLEWLLIDGYRERFPPTPHIPMRFFSPGNSEQT